MLFDISRNHLIELDIPLFPKQWVLDERDITFLNLMWKIYQPYADKHFRVEITHNFQERFWELYLGYTFLCLNYHLLKKIKDEGPDFIIDLGMYSVYIEATVPNIGKKLEGKNILENLEEGFVPDEGIVIRLRGAIEDKFQKYITYKEKGLIPENSPYIIAINGRKISFQFHEDESLNILKAVYALGPPSVILNKNTDSIEVKILQQEFVEKGKNRETIFTNLFLGNKYEGISGILFSYCHICNIPEIIGSDLIFIHNLYARNPLPLGWLHIGQEYWVSNGYLKWQTNPY